MSDLLGGGTPAPVVHSSPWASFASSFLFLGVGVALTSHAERLLCDVQSGGGGAGRAGGALPLID